MHAVLLVLILGPSKLKAHFYLTIYLQHKHQILFYVLVAMCEISVMLL